MPLIEITKDKVLAGLAPQELVSLEAQGAEISGIIISICNGIARDVNGSGKNDHLESGKCLVPDGLEHEAVVLIRHAILANFPSLEDLLGAVRADEYRAATATLREIRTGLVTLEPFDDSDPGIEIISEPKQNWIGL